MYRVRRHLVWTSWLAIGLVVGGAVWPALSQAAARATDRAGWTEICTATGMAWVHHDTGATDQPPDPATNLAGMGCAWCLAHAGGWGIPPSIEWSAGLVAASVANRPASIVAPFARAPWPAAWSRGPPDHV